MWSRGGGRWRAIVALVVVGLVTPAVIVYLSAFRLPGSYRPDLGDGERYGIDVSHYQGPIDWPAVAADGIEFAYIKSTEAGDWVDEYFAANWLGAQRAGLDVGAYHFFTFCRSGADQAANFLRVVPIGEIDLPMAVDLEFANNCSRQSDPEDLRAELAVFLDTVQSATGRPVVLYVEDEFDEKYEILDNFDGQVWERSIGRRPDDERWVVWQCSDRARVSGVDGGVDLNVMVADWP